MCSRMYFNSAIALLITIVFCVSIKAQPKWVKVTNQDCEYYEPYYEDGFEAIWMGNVSDGKANGKGVLEKFKNGNKYAVYEGSIVNGKIQGYATYTSINDNGLKRIFTGTFDSGEIIGKGTLIEYYQNGQTISYNGEIVNFYCHGYGSVKYADGSTFEGLFNMNQPYTGKYKESKNKTTWFCQGSKVDKIPKLPRSNYSPSIGIQQTEYFDENWCRCNIKKAKYYRLITYKAPNRPQGIVRDYYISGKLQSEFEPVYINYDDDNLNFCMGVNKWYYENGQISRLCNYRNNIIIGEDNCYYDNGKNLSQNVYDDNGIIVSSKGWFKSGKPNYIANFKDGRLTDGRYVEYDENGISCQVMKEDFSYNQSSWESEDASSKSEVISSNVLAFTGKDDNTTIRTNYIDIDQNRDFSIEGIVDLLDGKNDLTGYGLVLGFKDWSNYLTFIVAGNGKYKIYNTFEGVNVLIKDWTESTAINRGETRNLLKVMKFGDKMIFSINGTMVDRVDATLFRGNNFGMLIGGEGKYALENLIYKEYGVSNSSKNTPVISDEERWDGNGTGFFVDKRGYIATNNHVVNDAKYIQVNMIRNGLLCKYKAEIVQTDAHNDLAILRISDSSFIPFESISYNFSTLVKDVGTSVFALGYPMANLMGQEVKFTDGKISAKTGIMGDATVYQISVPIQPGNSGGPLFDYDGNLIGITSSALNRDLQTENVNYAIKSSYLNALIDVLPIKLNLPHDSLIRNKSLTEKIKVLDDYVALILVRFKDGIK